MPLRSAMPMYVDLVKAASALAESWIPCNAARSLYL
jgi:hypothetical protein